MKINIINHKTSEKVIAVVFNTSKKKDFTYSLTDSLFTGAYMQLAKKIESSGIRFVFVHTVDGYKGSGVFKRHSILRPGAKLILPLIDKREIKVDVVYDKGRFNFDDITVLNPPFIRDVCGNKLKSYEMFHQFHPETAIAKNRSILKTMLGKLEENVVVIKDLEGNGGHGVTITNANKVKVDALDCFPYVVQKYVDTSNGIPGLVSGAHDFRVVMLDGKVIYAMVRLVKAGEYKANVSYGGTILTIALGKIPKEVLRISYRIDDKFKKYDRLYSIDFGLDISGKWYVFELNPRVGIYSSSKKGDNEEYYVDKVADKLIDMANK